MVVVLDLVVVVLPVPVPTSISWGSICQMLTNTSLWMTLPSADFTMRVTLIFLPSWPTVRMLVVSLPSDLLVVDSTVRSTMS